MTRRPDLEEALHVTAWPGALRSTFRLRVWWHHPLAQSDPACALAIVSDDRNVNRGPSVTNAAEAVLAAVQKRTGRRLTDHDTAHGGSVVVVEHYGAAGSLPHRCAEVTLDARGLARWLPVGPDIVALAGGADLPETDREAADRLLADLGGERWVVEQRMGDGSWLVCGHGPYDSRGPADDECADLNGAGMTAGPFRVSQVGP